MGRRAGTLGGRQLGSITMISRTTSVDRPAAWPILQTKLGRCLNHQIIDGFECRRRQPVEAAFERVMLGHRIAAEIGELTQRQSVGDRSAQLAIIPVLDPHQNQRAQHLWRRQAAAALARLLQTAHEIAPHLLDPLVLAVKELRTPAHSDDILLDCRQALPGAGYLDEEVGPTGSIVVSSNRVPQPFAATV
jgi:hypothetical protein